MIEMPINQIKILDNRRPLRDVGRLQESIISLGILNPITLSTDNVLIAGLHRLEACKRLGWTTIPARVLTIDGLKAQLAEIDENLIRNELTVLERGEQLKRRKEIYEALHPESKKDVRGGHAKAAKSANADSAQAPAETFTKDTSAKTGKSQRVIQEEIQIADKIAPEVKDALRDSETANSKTDLLELSRKPVEEQKKIADKIVSGKSSGVRDAIREVKRESIVESLENIESQEIKAASGKFDVIVIDPPWPMEKIERDTRPNQSQFDYPVMSENDIIAFPGVANHADDDCHVFIWTTNKFLPLAFRCLTAWGLKYVACMVWHKTGGFQPYGLPQFNCEFVLYARKGVPAFIDTKQFFTCFSAPRGNHSEKPEEFYSVVRRVTAGRRLDIFNRRKIEGFDGWGNQAK